MRIRMLPVVLFVVAGGLLAMAADAVYEYFFKAWPTSYRIVLDFTEET